ncbi:MAG: helix-turn-helix domain-containing protein [Rhizobium sp.]|nr:helix-turn-helix domain-containing protein [Rhizobium sp.]
MSQQILSALSDILEKVALGAREAEIDEMVDRLGDQAGTEEHVLLTEALRRQVNAVREIIRVNALSERGLGLLIETTHDLSSTLALHDLLKIIVRRARSLVGANIAWVTILDDESGVFRTVTAEGHLAPATAEMTSRVDFGAVSLIMNSKSFFETQDYLQDTRFQHSPELDAIFRVENIVSLAGFPILSEDKVQGFLFVADRYSRRLSGRELSVLGSFALHAGVAMRNANAFRLLSEALGEAQRNRSALIDHIQRVEASAEAHDEMTSLLATGADIGLFLRRMAIQIDGAVFLMDDELTVREEYISSAYRGELAGEIKDGRFDRAPMIAANVQSRNTGRSVALANRGGEQCRMIALHAGTGRGDSLVISHRGELDAIEIRNLERSAVALAIAKLWNERRETEKLIASSTLLRHLVLVTPPDAATVSAIRDRLSLAADTPVVLALVVMSGLDRPSQTTRVRECAARANLLVDLFEDSYLAIGPEPAIRDFLHNLQKARDGWETGGIVSEPFPDLADAPAHLGRMNRALAVLRNMKQLDRFVSQSEVNVFARLFEAGDARRIAGYLQDLLGPIDRAFPKQQATLKQTLLCYFDRQHNLSRTADALGVHVNTIRQRLDALRDALGGWDDPVKALELHLALRLETILG